MNRVAEVFFNMQSCSNLRQMYLRTVIGKIFLFLKTTVIQKINRAIAFLSSTTFLSVSPFTYTTTDGLLTVCRLRIMIHPRSARKLAVYRGIIGERGKIRDRFPLAILNDPVSPSKRPITRHERYMHASHCT